MVLRRKRATAAATGLPDVTVVFKRVSSLPRLQAKIMHLYGSANQVQIFVARGEGAPVEVALKELGDA